MAEPPDERDRKKGDEDLFEELDEFFAPLDDAGWPEGEAPEAVAQEGAPEAPAEIDESAADPETLEEGWDVAIDVPEADELLAPVAPADEEPEAEEQGEVELAGDVEAESEGPLSLDDLRTPPPAYADLPGPAGDADEAEEAGEGEGEGEPVLPEEVSVSAEDLFEEEPGEPAVVDAAEGGPEEGLEEGEPQPEAVEAAAEHFATGIRDTPEEVERELLADLEAEESSQEVETATIAPPAPPAEAPTWQEAAEPVTEEVGEGAPPSGRNLTAAFASGILLSVAVLALLLIGKGAFAWFAGGVILLGQAELYAVMRSRRLQPATLLGLVCGALIIAGAYLHGPVAVPFGLFLAMGLTVLWYMAAPSPSRRGATINAGATILGTVYVPFLASFAILLLALPGDIGRNAFLVVVGLTVLYDGSAYAVGSLWGNRPLAPTVSPHKSWEGAIGGTLVILIVALAIVPAIDPFNSSRAVGLALVIAIVAPLGDLVESALKRDLGVKDMGTILPGHGGVLDRIDAILFAAPAAYYFLQLSF